MEKIVEIEVPVEVIRYIDRPQEYHERIVEVPTIEYVERIVEVPKIEYIET